ncbi:DNA-binding SARP family transcriptional activator/tetratricopeptide (TPR) repeat protein [Pseudonocardia eucalypti]|uniref:AAA family ATPase n=1 Tax=Pseudonocardia eucalypti TaxID=648755 RepID=UPI0016112D3C|nr:DNA-binding SARP family transcriptional activator/tetratricopeptide (TPR) repeat protein [Pseudonocardia eucalypti]
MAQVHLRFRLLGPFTVEGELAAPLPVGKARRVLAVLAERAGEFVSVATLIEALWDERPPEHADRNVAALISRLRRALGRDRIDGGAAGYRLVPESLGVDLREAVELVETAERELRYGNYALASTGAEQAAKRLAADVPLAGERDDPWVQQLRRTVARWLARARICWAGAALELGLPDVTVEEAGAVLRADPLDEQACRLVIRGHQRAGRSGAALIAYRQLQLAMSEQLGSDPSPATQAAYLAVLRSENPRARPRPGTPGPPDRERLVGRGLELATLRELWFGAVAGRPGLAVVTGEAGIGKSALVERCTDEPRRTGALVLSVTCFEAERSLYLQPLVQAVRTIARTIRPAEVRELAGSRLGTLAQLVSELTDATGPVDYTRATPELEHGRALDALAGFFIRLSARQPLLLTVEDVHHGGWSTVEALHFLTGRWAGSRMMVVVTERSSEDKPVASALRDVADAWLKLGPLSATEVATLAERSGLTEPSDRLYSWTGGSPLLVTELLRHSATSASLVVPGSLHEAVAERIAHAGDQTAELLAQGAVLGTAFTLDEVAGLSGIDVEDCARRAGRALRAGLLIARGATFRFPNDIVRQVAYESAPEPVRTSRHRRAAKLLADRPEAAARHYASAGDWPAAARAWMAAAHTAHLTFANTEAVELLGHAIGAARSAGDTRLLVEVLLRRGRAHTDLGHTDAAREDHQAALELARTEGDAELEARALEQLGWTALYARDAMHAVDFAEQATEIAESAAAAPGALPSAMLLLGRVRHWDGEYAGAEAAYDRVLAATEENTAEDATTALALTYRGALLQHQDRFAEARAVLARAAVLCRRTGEFRPMLQTLFFTALARGDSGDFAGALRSLDNARRLIDAEQVGFYRAGIETTTSWLWQELGQVRRAREHAERAVELAHRGGGALELEQELHALLAVADCDLLLGRETDAAAAVEAAAPMLERSLPFKPRAEMRLLEMRSRWDPAVAEQLLLNARRYSSRKYEALALRTLGKPERAAEVAASTGSDLLIAQLGAPADSRAAVRRIGESLPTELRGSFAAGGRLCLPAPRTH